MKGRHSIDGTRRCAHGWDSVGNWKATGREEPEAKSVPHDVVRNRRRDGSREETVTAELRSRDTMYDKELSVKKWHEAESINQDLGKKTRV